MNALQQTVATSADRADLHATVPTLLLELQTLLGALAATVNEATQRGRRPFRPDPTWTTRLGELAYGVYLLADQSAVDIDEAVSTTARYVTRRTPAPEAAGWPFEPR